jgi:cytochrome c peroxidase
MAGQPGDNPIADFAATEHLPGIWEALAQRLREIPEYVDLFEEVYPEIQGPEDIGFVHAANAIGAYEAVSFKANQSVFDRFLQGDQSALSSAQLRGMKLFYGEARCASCHAGPLQTDQKFHAIAMPQLGPGKGHGPSGREDWGRFAVTGDLADKMKFRTPTLRNIAITGPYGHSGAFDTLEKIVRHHLDPIQSLRDYDPAQFVVPVRPDLDEIDRLVMNDPVAKQAIIDANELERTTLTEEEIGDLIEFLESLTDTGTSGLLLGAPPRVPSGLPVED